MHQPTNRTYLCLFSFLKADAKDRLKKITPDNIADVLVSGDGKLVTCGLVDSKYVKMSTTASNYDVYEILADGSQVIGPDVSKVHVDTKKDVCV